MIILSDFAKSLGLAGLRDDRLYLNIVAGGAGEPEVLGHPVGGARRVGRGSKQFHSFIGSRHKLGGSEIIVLDTSETIVIGINWRN